MKWRSTSTSRERADLDGRRPSQASCVNLDIADYSTFHDYEAKTRFSQVLKKARLRIIEAHEEQLFSSSCTGSIFYLKCHGGNMFKEQPQQHVVSVAIEFVKPNESDPGT